MSYPYLPVNPCCTDVVLNTPCGCSSTITNGGCNSNNPCSTHLTASSTIVYDGPALTCTTAEPCDTLNVILQKIDEIICNLLGQINTLNNQINNITTQVLYINSEITDIYNVLDVCCNVTTTTTSSSSSTTTTTTLPPCESFSLTNTGIDPVAIIITDCDTQVQEAIVLLPGDTNICVVTDSPLNVPGTVIVVPNGPCGPTTTTTTTLPACNCITFSNTDVDSQTFSYNDCSGTPVENQDIASHEVVQVCGSNPTVGDPFVQFSVGSACIGEECPPPPTSTTTSTTTAIPCECLTFTNTDEGAIDHDISYNNCSGEFIETTISAGQVINVCGCCGLASSELVIISIGANCIGGLCPGETTSTTTSTSTSTSTTTTTTTICQDCIAHDVTIGTQVWTGCNLDVTTYRNGDPIPEVTDLTTWGTLTTGAWCYVYNDSANGPGYGKLYNWYAVNDPRGLAPVGYHIPSDAEFTTLTDYLGGEATSGSALKETGRCHWGPTNSDSTNSTGLALVGSGMRSRAPGPTDPFIDSNLGSFSTLWSSDEYTLFPSSAIVRYVQVNQIYVVNYWYPKTYGFSVRCIKDAESTSTTTSTSSTSTTTSTSSTTTTTTTCNPTTPHPYNYNAIFGTTLNSNFIASLSGACASQVCLSVPSCSTTSSYGAYFNNINPQIGDTVYGTSAGCILSQATDGYFIINVGGVYTIIYVVDSIIVDFPNCSGSTTTTTTSSSSTTTTTTTITCSSFSLTGLDGGGSWQGIDCSTGEPLTGSIAGGDTQNTPCIITTSLSIDNLENKDAPVPCVPSTTTTSSSTTTTTTTAYCSDCVAHNDVIGTQTWAGCNLNVSTYANGDPIPEVSDPTAWAALTTGAWCYPNGNPANEAFMGRLYNWYAINDPRGLAPAGYHIPTDTEWSTLTTYLGGESVAGGELKQIGDCSWTVPNTDAVDSVGFTALPAGLCDDTGAFLNIGDNGYWWTATAFDSTDSWLRSMSYANGSVVRTSNSKNYGLSVRVIQD